MGTATQQQQLSIPGLLAYIVRVTGMGFAVAVTVAVAVIAGVLGMMVKSKVEVVVASQ